MIPETTPDHDLTPFRVFPIRHPRWRTYRLVVDVVVDPVKLREGRNSRSWPVTVLNASIRSSLRQLPGVDRTGVTVTWVSGFRREVPR